MFDKLAEKMRAKNRENTEEEIEYIINAVTQVIFRLRSMSPVWRDLTEGRQQFVIR